MPPSLEGPLLKIDRAHEHIHEVAILANGFLASSPKPYEAIPERDAKTGDHLWKARVNQVVPARLSALVGDAVHNLRAALDHLVWQLCLLGNASPTERTEFPIYLDPVPPSRRQQGFDPHGVRKIAGIHPPAKPIIESVQPYATGHGVRDGLWRLHRLDIIDKHRFVPVISAVVPWISLTADISQDSAARIYVRPRGPFNDGDVLLCVPDAIYRESLPIPLEPDFSFDVALDIEGDVTRDLIRFLQDMNHYVRDEVVERFRPFFL